MVAASFSADEADQVRRSMAARRRKGGLEQDLEKLMSGMKEHGYTQQFAESIYQQILGFSGYGFPESHAASFALITYASCWLKCNEPAALVAALLNSQPMGFYSPSTLINNARRAQVAVQPVDVRYSNWDCTLERGDDGNPVVRLGFRLVSGLAEAAMIRLMSARQQAPLENIDDVGHRAQLDRGALDKLAHAGAFRGLSSHRNEARWNATGVDQLRGFLKGLVAADSPVELAEPDEAQEVVADYQTTGLTLGRHPLSFRRDRLKRTRVVAAARLKLMPDGRKVRAAGIVTHRQRPETASGVIFATLEDKTDTTNLITWPIDYYVTHDITTAQPASSMQ